MAQNNAGDTAGRPVNSFREAICIDTRRIYDACSAKECIRDMEVIFTDEGQQLIDCASIIKTRCAEVAAVYFEVSPLAFNKGFFSVDMTFFFKIVCTVCSAPGCAPAIVEGLGIFCKKVILFGSDAGVRTFSTAESLTQAGCGTPTVNVQVLDPMILASHICEEKGPERPKPRSIPMPPPEVAAQFSGCFNEVCPRRTLYVTLGLFSIVQLMRQVQVMIPIYDFCIPNSECAAADALNSDPCELFSKVDFPTDEFFPPKLADFDCD